MKISFRATIILLSTCFLIPESLFSYSIYSIDESQDTVIFAALPSLIKTEPFTMNVLVQAGLKYSLKDDDFQGGRTFEATNARISMKGSWDSGFYYRLFFNLVREPNVLDAYIGYKFSDELRLAFGAMKPLQTLDFIPDPGTMDFVHRTQITGLLVQSREIGVSAIGDLGKFFYFVGLYNGSGLQRRNNNNRFYSIGRLQYRIAESSRGKLELAISGSNGNSPGIVSGNSGPLLRGQRTIWGSDLRLEWNRWLLAAEYLSGRLEIEDIEDRKEKISGYYFTGGYYFMERSIFLSRWQSWEFREGNYKDHQLTLGINHDFNDMIAFQLNYDLYLPDEGEKQSGFSLILQLQF